MQNDEPMRRRYHVDLAGIQADAKKGPVRAAAFVGAVVKFIEAGIPSSIALPGKMKMLFLPDPLPINQRDDLAVELLHWVIGNALKELDQFTSLMLDRLWQVCELCKIARREVASDYVLTDISNQTSVSRKHRLVMEAANTFTGPIQNDQEYLATLSGARNCYAHNLGIVDERRAASGNMTVKWLKFVTLMEPDGHPPIYLDDIDLPWEAPAETNISMKIITFEKQFKLGERVTFTPEELMQICFLYQSIIDRCVLGVQDHMRASGIKI